jgi:Na+/H+ antiporter NhaC
MAMKQLSDELKKFNPRRSLLALLLVLIGSWILSILIPAGTEDFGVMALIPALFLIVYIFLTKRIIEALTLASIIGFMMTVKIEMESNTLAASLHTPLDVLGIFSGTLTEVMMSEDMAWLLIVCGLMGSIIALIEKAGGAFAFGEWVARRAKTRKGVLIWTWILGIVIFIDDYLNSLTVGSCMAPITDKKRVPREFLAYVVDSTAAPLCVLIPISTWAVFCGKLLETNGWAPENEGLYYFIKTIPFNFYGILAAVIVPLVILGIIPTFGPMKKAEQRVKDGGSLAPPDSDKIDMKAGIIVEKPDNPKIINFILPIIVLVAATVVADLDMQIGVLVTMLFMVIFYLAQKVITADDFADVMVTGIKNMILPLLLMVLAFLFAEVNDQIGFTSYVISSATNIMTPALMPFIIFLVLACTEFITGTNWGMYIIALPIVIPLAGNLDVNMPLAVSAVLSAGVFGSHICFYSDATILTSAATGCNNFRHAITQAPFGILAAAISAVAYLIVGFVMAP